MIKSKLVSQDKDSLQSLLDELRKELETLRIDQENTTSSMHRFNAKEESYKNELKMIKQEMESLANIKNQEMQSLKFEISSAEIQYQTAASVNITLHLLLHLLILIQILSVQNV